MAATWASYLAAGAALGAVVMLLTGQVADLAGQQARAARDGNQRAARPGLGGAE